MVEPFEFELVFALPAGDHDVFLLSDAVHTAGYEDAVVGTGDPRLLAVELEAEGEDAEVVILQAARAIIRGLPCGTTWREVRPDLVSLADVAEKLKVRRQALQQRDMPLPTLGGLYRIDEMFQVLSQATEPQPGRRRARFDVDGARKWFLAGKAARKLNAMLTMHQIDPAMIKVLSKRVA